MLAQIFKQRNLNMDTNNLLPFNLQEALDGAPVVLESGIVVVGITRAPEGNNARGTNYELAGWTEVGGNLLHWDINGNTGCINMVCCLIL